MTTFQDKVLRKAGIDPKTASKKRVLTASQRYCLAEAVRIARGQDVMAAAEPPIHVDKMPGFSPMQLRQQVDRLADIEKELAIMQERLATELAAMKGLEKEQKEGLDKLKVAGRAMTEKGKIIVETKKAILSFTAYLQSEVPGIEQMIAREDEVKPGQKAGDFFGRISAKFGEEIAKGVEVIYGECKTDLTHMASAVKTLKIVAKTASISPAIIKTAGVAEFLVEVKDWLAGTASAAMQRVLGFVGDITKWVKGFLERTKIADKAKDDVLSAIKNLTAETKKALAAA